jgi:hypothetical protein
MIEPERVGFTEQKGSPFLRSDPLKNGLRLLCLIVLVAGTLTAKIVRGIPFGDPRRLLI